MANIRIADSLKYGAKFFLLFLAVVIVGGGGMALGGALLVPELQASLDGSGFDTASLAGGAILVLLGTVAWFSGTFALTYKLIGDAVATGLGEVSTVPAATAASEDDQSADQASDATGELGPSPGEQAAAEHGPGQTVPGESAESTGDAGGGQPTTADSAGEPATPAASSDDPVATDSESTVVAAGGDPEPSDSGVAGESPPEEPAGQVRDSPDQQPASTQPASAATDRSEAAEVETNDSGSRERTAEEIAFGSSEREESDSGSGSTTGDEPADQPLTDTSRDDESEEEFEADETVAADRENVETANDSSADPLADNFDE